MRDVLSDRLPPSLVPLPSQTPKQCRTRRARHAGLCDALSDIDLGLLALVAHRICVPTGKIFIAEGEIAKYFYDINDGDARVYKSLSDGRRQIIGFTGVGQFLGFAVNATYAFTAEAMNDVILCRFERDAMTLLFDKFPSLERRLLDVATHELVIAQEQMLLLGRKSALERLAGFLLSWAEKSGHETHEPVTMRLPMSRVDLADYLGLTVETVSRSFSQLKRLKLIAFTDAHAVTLLKCSQLCAIAAGEAQTAEIL